MFEIKFNSPPRVEHVNLRKEGAEHDILAVDVKVSGEVPALATAPMLGCPEDVVKVLWAEDLDGSPARLTGITTITSWTKFENCTATIEKMRFEGVVAKKFKIKPIGGGNAELTFSIGISGIPQKDVGKLGELAFEKAKVYIHGEEDLFDPGEGPDGSEEGTEAEDV